MLKINFKNKNIIVFKKLNLELTKLWIILKSQKRDDKAKNNKK